MDHGEHMMELLDYAEDLTKEIREKYPAKLDRQIVALLISQEPMCEHFAEVYKRRGLMK